MAKERSATILEKLNLAGMILSVLCIIHCFSVPIIIALFPLVGAELLHDPIIEIALVGSGLLLSGGVVIRDYRRYHHKLSIVLAVFAGFALMIGGILSHGTFFEQLLLIGGASIVTWGMYQNYKAHQKVCSAK